MNHNKNTILDKIYYRLNKCTPHGNDVVATYRYICEDSSQKYFIKSYFIQYEGHTTPYYTLVSIDNNEMKYYTPATKIINQMVIYPFLDGTPEMLCSPEFFTFYRGGVKNNKIMADYVLYYFQDKEFVEGIDFSKKKIDKTLNQNLILENITDLKLENNAHLNEKLVQLYNSAVLKISELEDKKNKVGEITLKEEKLVNNYENMVKNLTSDKQSDVTFVVEKYFYDYTKYKNLMILGKEYSNKHFGTNYSKENTDYSNFTTQDKANVLLGYAKKSLEQIEERKNKESKIDYDEAISNLETNLGYAHKIINALQRNLGIIAEDSLDIKLYSEEKTKQSKELLSENQTTYVC